MIVNPYFLLPGMKVIAEDGSDGIIKAVGSSINSKQLFYRVHYFVLGYDIEIFAKDSSRPEISWSRRFNHYSGKLNKCFPNGFY